MQRRAEARPRTRFVQNAQKACSRLFSTARAAERLYRRWRRAVGIATLERGERVRAERGVYVSVEQRVASFDDVRERFEACLKGVAGSTSVAAIVCALPIVRGSSACVSMPAVALASCSHARSLVQ